MFGSSLGSASTSSVSLADAKNSKPYVLPVIKENKLNESAYHGNSMMRTNANADYADIVCTSCQSHLLNVYHHCLRDQDKAIPSPHDINEIEDGKRRNPPPYFELLKDPVKARNTLYIDSGEKTAVETRAKVLSKKLDEIQDSAIHSMFEKKHLMNGFTRPHSASPERGRDHLRKSEMFAGGLYRHNLQFKSNEIGKLRAQLLEKTESEIRESENVRKLRKALGKSMQYYIKAEEWQQEEASLLQNDIRTLKKEISVIMACLIHAETEKKELRHVLHEKDSVISQKDNHILDMEKQLNEMRTKLHDSLKDYIRLNDRISTMAKQAETGNEQAEHRNNILQKTLDTLSKESFDANSDLSKYKRKCGELESEMEFLVKQVNDLTKVKADLTAENRSIAQELYNTQQTVTKMTDDQTNSKIAILDMQNQIGVLNENHKKEKNGLQRLLAEVTDSNNKLLLSKQDDESMIAKIESENARLRASLKENVLKKEGLEVLLKEQSEIRKREAQERDRMVHELTEQTRIAQTDAKMHEEKRERALRQLNDLQSALDKEMTQSRMLMVEIERLKRDYVELKTSSRVEMDKMIETKSSLTNDKLTLTKHVYEVRQELKDKKEELANVLLEFRGFQNETKEKVYNMERRYIDLKDEKEALNKRHEDLIKEHDAAVAEHKNLVAEHDDLIKQHALLDSNLKKIKSDFMHLTGYKDNLLKEKAALSSQCAELEQTLEGANKKIVELQQMSDTKDREYTITRQAREALISSLSAKANELKEEVRKLNISNQQYKESNQNHVNLTESYKKELDDTLKIKLMLEEKLDELRTELSAERKTRIDFEKLHRRIDRKFQDKEADYLKKMSDRDQKLADIDDYVGKENNRMKEVIDIILPRIEAGLKVDN